LFPPARTGRYREETRALATFDHPAANMRFAPWPVSVLINIFLAATAQVLNVVGNLIDPLLVANTPQIDAVAGQNCDAINPVLKKQKMRRLKLQMQMTINGYVAGPNGENDWMTWNPDDEFLAFLVSLIDSSDTLVLGRKTAEGIIPFWEDMAKKNPVHPFAKKIVDIPKVVFTKTLDKSTWNNTTLAKEDIAEEIAKLKKQNGKDILVFGGAGFVSSLIKEKLIDEYHLIVNPTAIGNGMTIFNSLDEIQKFSPLQAKLYPGGKTVLSYKPKDD
jgi:dihydrofolate reductase